MEHTHSMSRSILGRQADLLWSGLNTRTGSNSSLGVHGSAKEHNLETEPGFWEALLLR